MKYKIKINIFKYVLVTSFDPTNYEKYIALYTLKQFEKFIEKLKENMDSILARYTYIYNTEQEIFESFVVTYITKKFYDDYEKYIGINNDDFYEYYI